VIESPTLVLALQADGIGMNPTTFGIVSAVVVALVGAITFLFRMVTSDKDRRIDRLERENDDLRDALIDALRVGHRAADVGDEAARELLKRRATRPK